MARKQRVGARQREAVARRAAYCCEYCRSQESYATELFSVDHIVPRDQGGTNDLDNLALCCQGCNNHKFTKTEVVDPATGDSAPLFNPRQQRWLDHFAWSQGFTLIAGITPTGRATVETLRLNRPSLVNLRRMLYAAHAHPPLEVGSE